MARGDWHRDGLRMWKAGESRLQVGRLWFVIMSVVFNWLITVAYDCCGGILCKDTKIFILMSVLDRVGQGWTNSEGVVGVVFTFYKTIDGGGRDARGICLTNNTNEWIVKIRRSSWFRKLRECEETAQNWMFLGMCAIGLVLGFRDRIWVAAVEMRSFENIRWDCKRNRLGLRRRSRVKLFCRSE